MRLTHIVMATLLVLATLTSGSMAAQVAVTVNGSDITDTEINARAAMLRVERRGNSNSARLKLALDELIDEKLMLQEAERIGVSVSNAQVDEAFINVARNVNLNADKLTELLVGSGVNPNTLKDRLRANIAWADVVQRQVSGRVQVSELELDQQALDKLEVTTSYDYILKEVRFIIPSNSNVSASRRTSEANQYRSSFQGCDSAVELSMSYTDAAVIDMGRRHATQLPEAIASELANLEVGGITKPRVGNGGVTMLAVCAKSSARDTTFIKEELRQEAGNEKFEKEVAAFLQSLRDRAVIINR